MSIKVEQYKAPQGTKIYLVDPASLRLKLNQQNLHNGKTQHITSSIISNGSSGSSSSDTAVEPVNQKKLSNRVHERKHRKRKATSEERRIEDEDDLASKIGTKETTTRTGRISKISKCFDPQGTTVSSNTSDVTTVKVKKREPASVFRCPVCQKVYIGYVKLKSHFRKFPDHYNYGNTPTTTPSSSTSTTATTTSANNSIITNNFSSNQNIPSILQQLKKCNPVSLSASASSSTTTSSNNSSKVEVSNIETQTENIFGLMEGQKIIIASQDPHAQNILVTQQSQSTSSTNGLNIIERLNSLNPPAYTFATTNTKTSNSSTTNGFCVNNNNNNSGNDFNHYRGNHNTNDNINSHNNNIKSNNNNNTLDVNHSNHELDGHIFDDTLRLLLHSPIHHPISSSSNNTNSCIGGSMMYQNNSNNNNNNHLHGAHTTTNRQPNILSCLSPSNVVRHNSNANSNSHLHNEAHHHHHQNVSSSSQKRVWDVLEEKLIHQGINEILLELTDVAEKLAKIARDKIIPIREEEEEQLRINASVPIVQVDSPFLSHLLDLPLGTYYYKEDAGRRPLLPPPISAELSLTGETELFSKFLTPDIDLINLPHLTNIDVFLQ